MRLLVGLLFFLLWISSFSMAESFYEERDFREIFLKEFKRLLPNLKGEITLEKFRYEPDNLKIPKGVPYKISWIGTPRAGSNSALLIFDQGKGLSSVIRLWGYVEVKISVPTLKRDLPPKSLISEEDLAFEKLELSKLPHDVLLNKESIVGKETRSGLKAGSILRASYLSEPVLIKRNQVVEIVAKGKNLLVRAKGVALENGRLNELIRVKNLSSNKVIQGKVAGEGLVEVPF